MKFSEQAGILFISKSITASMLFMLGPILVRFLTKTEYGTYMQANLVILSLVALAPLGLSQSTTYFIPKLGNGKHYAFVVRTLSLLIAIGGLSGLVLFAARTFLGTEMNNQALTDLAPYLGALIAVTIISDTTETIFMANNQAKVVAIILPVKAVARVVGTVIPLLGGAGLQGVLQGITAVMFAESVILYGYHWNQSRSLLVSERVSLKEQFTYSLPIGIAMIVGMLGATIDKYIMALLVPPEEYAVYARGAFDLPLVGILPNVMFGLLMPRFVGLWLNGEKQEMITSIRNAMHWIALVSYPAMCLCIVLGHYIITFLFTDTYADSGPIFQIYMLTMLFAVNIFDIIFRAAAKNSIVLMAMIVKVSLAALLCTVLMKLFGNMFGIVIGLVIAHGLAMLFMWYMAARELHVSVSCLMPWKVNGNILLLSVAVALLIVPVTWWAEPKWLVLLTGGSLFALIFTPTALYFNLFPEFERPRWLRFGRQL